MANDTAPQLLDSEQILQLSHGNALALTNLRVLLQLQKSGGYRYTSIGLDRVASCGLVTTSYPLLLVLALLAALVGMLVKDTASIISFVAAVVFVVAYVVMRQEVVKISSIGREYIVVPTSGAKRDALLFLLAKVDEARFAVVGSPPPA